MAHGPDTEELLRRIANSSNGMLNVSGLNITSLPELPPDLKILWCNNTHITSLPSFPPGFEAVNCSNTQVTTIPPLPPGFEGLSCCNTPITTLPEPLPPNLDELYIEGTQISVLPELPPKLQYLNIQDTPIQILPDLPDSLRRLLCYRNSQLILKKDVNEKLAQYKGRWSDWREEQASKVRCRERSRMIKEDLVAAVWAPQRIQQWLENGGFELIDTL